MKIINKRSLLFININTLNIFSIVKPSKLHTLGRNKMLPFPNISYDTVLLHKQIVPKDEVKKD